MNKTFKTTIASLVAVFFLAGTVQAFGTLTPTGTAGDDTQYSTKDIYQKLQNFANDFTEDSGAMTVPGSINESFNTLSEIYGLLEAEEADLVAENIADGVTVFGVEGTKENLFPATGQINSSGTTLSYTDNTDGTVTDNVTGFIWQKDGAYQASSWQDLN